MAVDRTLQMSYDKKTEDHYGYTGVSYERLL